MHPMMVAAALATRLLAIPLGPAGPGGPEEPKAASTAVAVRAPTVPAMDARGGAPWSAAPVVSDFVEFVPTEGAPARFRTEVRVMYDDRNLYVLVRAYDPHPDSLMHALTRRDIRGPSDQLKVMIDSYNDRRSGYEFAVNPDGVKRDYAMYDDGNEDDSWNGVWDVATRVDSLGWTAEFRIPFSQLRYQAGARHTFGFGVWRDIERYKERVSWPAFRPTKTGVSSQLGQLTGIEEIQSPHHMEVTPYVLARNESRPTANGFSRAQVQGIGADLKYSISPNATLDATVNPDFGQVESDPAVLNLTAFETFLQERRPFFVEGTGLYHFRLNCYIVHDCGNETLFYSRRIGRAPQLLGTYGDASSPQATSILGATKLTARSQGGFSFGVLDAVTEREVGPSSATLEPWTNYAVLRARQELRGGQSGFSLIATAVNRSLDRWSQDYLRRSAYVAGGDFRHKFGGGQYQVTGSLTASRVAGSPAAIAATQRDASHEYQRPDAGLVFDSTRTSLVGHAEEIELGKYGGGITRFETAYTRQSAGYEPNDLGYLQRADQQTWDTWASLNWFKPRFVYKSLRWNFNQWNAWTTGGTRLQNAFNTNVHVNFKNNWWLHAGGTLGNLGDVACDRCARGGPAIRRARSLSPWLGIQGDDRRKLVPSVWANGWYGDDGHSRYLDLNPGVDIRVSTRLEANVGVDLSRNEDDMQWYGNFTDAVGTHYTFAHLDQRTLSLNAQASYTITPDLTIQLFAQPFVSKGEFSNIRELSATPRAATYDARLTPFAAPAGSSTGFSSWQLVGNSVLRWEYRPGSTIFLVWSHNRSAYDGTASRDSWSARYHDLFALHPANTFLIKVAYWLGR